jgi:hypothetical protein
MKFVRLLNIVSFVSVLFCSSVQAEPAKKKELPQTGVLSATGNVGTHINTPGVWGGDSITGGSNEKSSEAPISGSVMRVGSGTWKAIVQNSSIDTYSADLEVAQVNDRGSVVKSDTFSVTLKPGASYERSFSANSSSRQGLLKMKGWKRLTKNSTKSDEASPEKK